LGKQHEGPKFFEEGGHFSGFPQSDGAAHRLKFFWLLGVAALGVGQVWGGSESAVFHKGATCWPVTENEGPALPFRGFSFGAWGTVG